MGNQINSNKELLDAIEALRKKLQVDLLENRYVSSLENYCTILRNAIINGELGLPNTSSFQFYFSKLKDQGNIDYLFSLLHECWILVHPNYLFNSELKNDDIEVLLMKSLSKYNKIVENNNTDNNNADNNNTDNNNADNNNAENNNVDNNNTDNNNAENKSDKSQFNCYAFMEDYDSPRNIVVASAYYRKISAINYRHVYHEYLRELRGILINIFKERNISLTESFIPCDYLNVSLNRKQLDKLFEDLSSGKYKYLKNDKETKQTFLAIFESSLLAGSKKIQWMDLNPKNNMPSISSLYTLFEALKVKMNFRNKSIICNFFNDARDHSISPESLKSRNDSENLRNIRNIVNGIFNSVNKEVKNSSDSKKEQNCNSKEDTKPES